MKELTISDSHLDQIEHLLAQSMNGIHLLFDNETIARILKVPTEEKELFHMRNLDKIQELFANFVQIETFHGKQEFLHALDQESFELLLRTSFISSTIRFLRNRPAIKNLSGHRLQVRRPQAQSGSGHLASLARAF